MKMQKVYVAIHYLMERFREMGVWEVGVFKTCLLSFGVLIGIYSGKNGRKFAPFFWITLILSYIVLIYHFFLAPSLQHAEHQDTVNSRNY